MPHVDVRYTKRYKFQRKTAHARDQVGKKERERYTCGCAECRMQSAELCAHPRTECTRPPFALLIRYQQPSPGRVATRTPFFSSGQWIQIQKKDWIVKRGTNETAVCLLTTCIWLSSCARTERDVQYFVDIMWMSIRLSITFGVFFFKRVRKNHISRPCLWQ